MREKLYKGTAFRVFQHKFCMKNYSFSMFLRNKRLNVTAETNICLFSPELERDVVTSVMAVLGDESIAFEQERIVRRRL